VLHAHPSDLDLLPAVTPAVEPLVAVHRLRTGESGQIRQILGHPDHVHRLEEFGLRLGTVVEMFRPGNPCILRISGNKVCLRSEDVVRLFVRPAPGADW
jgi:Fe2+ transport system protein FeoA